MSATWYGIEDGYGIDADKLWTASGERFDPHGLSAASPIYPLGVRLLVCHAERCVAVTVNDRCGGCQGLDLSRGAFEMIAPLSRGRIEVDVWVIE